MRIKCLRSELVKIINISMRAVPVHTTMTVLECIMINAWDNRIRFTTNDTELGIETIVPGDIIEEGAAAINAKMLFEIIRRVPEEDVEIRSDDNYNVRIISGKSNLNIPGMSGEDFTYLPSVQKENCVTVSQFTLKELIRQTIFSIASNENNKIMTGEQFRIMGDGLRVVALDGHRISIRNTRLMESYGDRQVIVPGKSLNEIVKILGDSMENMVNIYFSDNHIVFEMEDTTVVSRLIDGEYFRIDSMLSNDYETKIIVNRRELLSCIDRSILFVKENDKKPIIFDIHDGYMKMFIESTLGSMNEEIDIDKEGRDIMIGFNPKLMIDALRVVDDEFIDIYMVNPKAPCFIRNNEEDYIYIILPINFVR